MISINEYRFLVVAPLGRDEELISRFLSRFGVHTASAPDVASVVELLSRGDAAGLIVTDEALTDSAAKLLQEHIKQQPDWSDLPILILTSFGTTPQRAEATFDLQERFGNVTLVERPVRIQTLVTAVRSALRARRRQYESRDNMSKQHQIEEALRRTEKLAIAGTMAASLAHEINNPLTSVTNYLYLVGEADSVSEAHMFAKSAEGELRRISEIVQQTLQYHRAPMIANPVDMGELVESTLQLLRARLARHNIQVVKKLETTTAWAVSGEIRQVLANLAANSIDAMRSGGTLTISTGYSHRRDGQLGVRVSVGDTGTGIAPQVRKHLFQQFFTTKGDKGTGLGLWLTRDLVGKNGGFLQCKSRVGDKSGTVFSFWIPAAAHDVNAESVAAAH